MRLEFVFPAGAGMSRICCGPGVGFVTLERVTSLCEEHQTKGEHGQCALW